MKSAAILLIAGIMVSGCAGFGEKSPEPSRKNDATLDVLSSAAMDVRDEMKRLNAGKPVQAQADRPNVAGCTSRMVSIDFDGDAMLFIEDLRKSGFCDIRILGKKPHQELILSLHHRKTPLWKVLEDAGVQLGNLAAVAVSANSVVFTFGEVRN